MIPPIVHWQSSSTSIKPNISNCSRCLSQDWLDSQVWPGIVLCLPARYCSVSITDQESIVLQTLFLPGSEILNSTNISPSVFLLTASVSFRRQITKVKTFPLTENIFFYEQLFFILLLNIVLFFRRNVSYSGHTTEHTNESWVSFECFHFFPW